MLLQSFYNTLYSARIVEWRSNVLYPFGVVVKAIGVIGDIAAETQAILAGNNVDDSEFPPEVIFLYNASRLAIMVNRL